MIQKPKPGPPTHRRRGMAVVVIVVVLSVLALAVAGSVRPVRQETDIATLRIQTLRAFYAAESGVTVIIGSLRAGIDPPVTSETITWDQQTLEFEAVPATTGTATLTGRSGQAQRRISIEID